MMYGYIVVCGDGEHFFSDASAALRFSAYMGVMGHDSLFYLAYLLDDGKAQRLERMSENEVRMSIRIRDARAKAGGIPAALATD